ncbi:hypothetical protein OVN20_07455 [Microcella daejeonensis]|uniref:hypothetical protein n=1 Tax=Microcella daejeonensis TaxID=2994971 RepID=UPI00226E330D|nr:hypothetical protein [Microcella daejeonensis]WAB82951.1 hypothetical protein OVN20_07455 [Microcella daejeonensis]
MSVIEPAPVDRARLVDEAVLAVEGVRALFPARAALSHAARELAAGRERPARSIVQTGADGTLAVLVAIAVESSAQAPATARAVAASLRRMLGESASITVRIRRVTPPADAALSAAPALTQVESAERDVPFSG